ncbi:MAG: EamA family transporter [Candidatus Abawacabacteria bacterium]|nr:EamA family transporter [Candidatus Abawacabacteria bacterium]
MPQLMNWLYFALLASASFGFYNFFSKLATDKFSASITLMFVAGTAFIVAAITTFSLKTSGLPLQFSFKHIHLPILAGFATGIAEILYFMAFAKGAPLSIGAPFVIGTTIIIASILGMIFLREPLSLLKSVGFLLTLSGLILLAKS